MFVQVIQGSVKDPEAARAAFDRWVDELGGGADGWLGSTTGVTADGTLVALARFESEEAARRNSDRPEQGAWWEETSRLFDGEPTFHDSTRVSVDTYGDMGSAGFVQVMRGRTTDPDRGWELMQADGGVDWATLRPDILGTVMVGHAGPDWTMAIYFTSEAAAREGEAKEMPPELQEQMQQVQEISDGEPQYLDLTDPWLAAPR